MSVARQIVEAGLVVIIRARSGEGLVEAARALWEGGVRVMEVTLNTPGALGVIEDIREGLPGMLCGTGTVLSVDDAVAAREAGAQFIVMPTLQADVVAFCKGEGLAVVPGCASPTEMVAARRAGADFVKVFPANRFGLVDIREVLEELPGLRLIPTGGVTPDNVTQYFAAGCAAVAAGATLVSKELLARRDWAGLSAATGRFVEAVGRAREGR